VILQKIAISLLVPLSLATTTLITPQDRGFSVGTGEQRPLDYLVATYVPTGTPPFSNDTVEGEIIAEFGLNSTMYRIAQCESRFRQFDASGEVLRGLVNPLDRGVYQINEKYWLEESLKLNIDIYDTTGNIDMARHILKVQGVGAWAASQDCWRKTQ
jgi:hypothetical protein